MMKRDGGENKDKKAYEALVFDSDAYSISVYF